LELKVSSPEKVCTKKFVYTSSILNLETRTDRRTDGRTDMIRNAAWDGRILTSVVNGFEYSV